jgi:uncharacterized repeat protein (TIGR02543 family)
MKKRLISLLVAACMIFALLPVSAITAFAEEPVLTGYCGADSSCDSQTYNYSVEYNYIGHTFTETYYRNAIWTLTPNGENTYKLTISGAGAMGDLKGGAFGNPWNFDLILKLKVAVGNVYDAVTELEIADGITEIGAHAFEAYRAITRVALPQSVTKIGNSAFAGSGLTGDLVIPENVEKIEEDAFNRTPDKIVLGDIGLSNIIVENKDARLQLSKRAFANLKDGTKLYFMSAIENPTTTADKYWDDSQVIVLNTNGGTVKSNSTPDAKTGLYIPEKAGYTFAGWYDNAGLTGEAVTTPAETGKTYYAKWEKNKYTVTLENNNHGVKPADKTVEDGDFVTDLPKLSDSTNEWVFTGWYTDAECTTEYKSEPITKATTLYAGWRKYTNTSLAAKVSKSDYLVNTPADVNVTVTPGDDIKELKQNVNNIKILLTYDDDVTSVMLNGKVLDKKEYTIPELMQLMGQNRELKLDVTYGKAGTHTFDIALKNGNKIVSKCSTDIVVAEEAAELTPATKLYTLTVKNADVTIKNGDEEIKAEKNDKGELIAKVPEKADVTVTYTSQSDAVAFDQWTITTDETLDVDVKNNPLKFQMPAGGVTIEAMTKDASIEEDEPNILGTAAVVGTAAVGTAILAWQGYQLGTELYLKTALPAGTAIPTNRAELALLVWNHAGKPAPAAVLPADATDPQKAIAWAVENDLLKAAKDNGETYVDTDSVSRVEVIRVWNKAQEK